MWLKLQTLGGLQHVCGVQFNVAGVKWGYKKANEEKGYADFEEHNELRSPASSRNALYWALQYELEASE